ncbi:MAG: hypothetical protein AAF899_12315 [Pseudomonadota bacterium]
METTLYTIHQRRTGDAVRVIGDGRHALAVVPPVWALWRGLWASLIVMIAGLVGLAFVAPAAVGTLYLGFVLLAFLEGATIERAELWLRGWREIAVAEARTPEGAEEAWVTGHAVLTG